MSGSYINFVSMANASTTLSDRGVVAMPFVADWGQENEVVEVTAEDFRRINFMSAISIEASVEKVKSEVPILGQKMKGNKAVGLKGTGTATFHMNTSIFRDTMKHFKDTGEDLYFDMIITNNDPTSDAGRQTTILKGCNLNKIIVAKVDANNGSYLDETIDFTFEDFDMPETFKELEGM